MMNSGSESRNPLSQKPSSAAHSSRTLSSRLAHAADSSSAPKDPPASQVQRENGRAAANGYDSDAETDILSDTEKRKPIKKKREPADRQRASPAVIKSEPSLSHPTSRRSSMNGGSTKETRRVNGVDRKDGEGKRPSTKVRSVEKATSSSSRAQSAEASLSVTSGPSETAYDSPDRVRQSLSVEPRKRKLSDEHHKSKLEPPRQRPRLDSAGAKKRASSPSSNPPPSAGHKRSISNQSGVARITSRKKRDASANSQQSDDRRKWAEDSSEDSESPPSRKDRSIPHLVPPKSRSMSQRALTSPARTNSVHSSRRADKYGTTPLAKACEKGQLDAVKKAYEQAPEELDQEDNGGFTPLQKASLGGHFEVVRFLLEKGCRRDCFSKEERDTPLIDAVENDHYEVVKLLLDSGVNPYHANKKGVRAIDAVNYDEENAKKIEAALKKAMADYQGAEEDHDDEPTNETAASQIRREGGGLRPDLLYQALTPENLLKYSTSGDLEAIGMLLESVEPTVQCAVAAARGGHVVALGLLLASAQSMERDPSPIKYEETPMLAAIGRGHIKIIELLLDQDNFNPCRKTRDGKTYYEVASERRGPRWQSEYELLKSRYDAYKDNSGKKRDSKGKTAPKDASPKSPRLSKTSIKKPEKPEKTEKSEKPEKPEKLAATEEDKKKRLSGGSTKDSSKDLSRKRRVVDEDSSEVNSDAEHPSSRRRLHGSSKPQRKTSSASRQEQPSQPSSPRAKFGRRPKVKREEVDADNDVTMDDVPPKEEKLSRIRRREEAERKAREEAEAQLRAETEAREKEERETREREEAERKKVAAEAAARKREEFLSSLPIMIRRALERGLDRPMLSYRPVTPASSPGMIPERAPRVIGVKEAFLPLLTVKWQDLDWSLNDESKMNERFILSHQVTGVLGLPELDVRIAYPHWETLPVTKQHLEKYVKGWDISKVMMETMWPQAGQKGYDHDMATKAITECKAQFIALHDKLRWVKLDDFKQAFEELKTTEAGKKLLELGEPKEVIFFNLRRPLPPGYKPLEDPDRCVKMNAVKPKPAHLRSGLGSVYIPRGKGDSPLMGSESPLSITPKLLPVQSVSGSPAPVDEDIRMVD